MVEPPRHVAVDAVARRREQEDEDREEPRMTDEQLEAAARKLCEIRGIEPDRVVPVSPPPTTMGYVPAVALALPAWREAQAEILGFYQVAKALDSVLGKDLP